MHSESYNFYCESYKKNICVICEKDHINHKKISLGEIMPDKNKIEEERNNLRNKLDELEKEIQIIINKFTNVLTNMGIYYNIIDDLASAYDIRKRNFQILKNLNDISEYNSNIIKDLDQIINEKNINIKFKNIMDIYDKINNKEIKESNEIKESINDNDNNKNKNEPKNEIKNEGKEKKSDFDKKLLKEIRKIQKIGHQFEGIVSDFDFDSMKKINNFNINNNIDRVLILKDGRILCYQYKKGSTIYIYKLEEKNNAICDTYEVESGIRDIIELDDEKLLLTGESNIKLYQLKEKEIVFLKEEKLKKMSNAHLYCLSNKKIIIYDNEYSNVYIYSYKDNDLIYDKSIDTEKEGVNDVCEINNKEIAISCYAHGRFYLKEYFLLFYDLEKEQKITILDIGGKLCYLNDDNLIVINEKKIYLIDLMKHEMKNEISSRSSLETKYKVFGINKNGFIVVKGNIYYYEIEKNSKIAFKDEKIMINTKFIEKYQTNKLLIGNKKNIEIFEFQ